MSLVKVQRKGVVTLPTRLRNKVGLAEGDVVEASVQRGKIILTPKLVIDRSGDDEYTPAQRRVIDARLAKALAEVKKGRVYGPFDTIEEMSASLRESAKKLKGKTNRSARR